MKKTVLITGGAGFIGSHLSEKLLKQNYSIVCIDNFDNFYNPNIKKNNIESFIKNRNYSLIKADVRNFNNLKLIFKKSLQFDSIIHLAARAGVRPSINKPLLYQKVNVQGTYNLLYLSTKFKVKQFIFASSSSVYGNAKVPFNEETSETFPLSPYGATKLAGEFGCYTFHKNFGIPVTILRFFSVYGPRGRPDMAPYLFTHAIYNNKLIDQYGDGSSSRDWTYIDDVIEGILQSIKNPFDFEIINLGGNKPISLSNLISTIEKNNSKKLKKKILPARNDEGKVTYADITKAKKLLKWKPKISFDEGMKRFTKWFIKERLKRKVDHL